jgi:hypothetical protein
MYRYKNQRVTRSESVFRCDRLGQDSYSYRIIRLILNGLFINFHSFLCVCVLVYTAHPSHLHFCPENGGSRVLCNAGSFFKNNVDL